MKYLWAILPIFAFFICGSAQAAAPANDDLANAISISNSTSLTLAGSTAGATTEFGEDLSSVWSTFGGKSVWYKWTAPISGNVTLNCASVFSPILEVYDAAGVSSVLDLSGTPLAFNNIVYLGGTTTSVSFDVVAGSSYLIKVESYIGDSTYVTEGYFSLTLQEAGVALSDSFAGATQIDGTAISVTGENTSATSETGELTHGGKVASHSVWLQWTAPAHGSVTVSTAGSFFDTLLSVYKSNIASPTIRDLISVGENDNENFLVKTSAATFTVNSGQTYYIAVDGAYSQAAYIKLALNFHPTPPSITKISNQIVYNGTTATFTAVANGTGLLLYQWQRAAAGSKVWANIANGTVSSGGTTTDDGVTYAGATSSTLTVHTVVNPLVPMNNDQFRCVVTDTIGSSNSSAAKLIVTVIDTVDVTIRGGLSGSLDLTSGAGSPPLGTLYYAKGLPTGLTLAPTTGLVTGTPTSKPGTYTVTYWTQTGKIKTPSLTVVIVVAPLDTGLSGGFETILNDPIALTPVGKVELLVNATTGAFTGRLTCSDAKAYSLKGALTLNAAYNQGTASVTINRGKTLAAYQLDLTIDESLAPDQVILATLTDETTTPTTIGHSDTGVQLATYTSTTPTPWQGSYTLIFDDPSVTPPVSPNPEGTGFGLVTVQAVRGLLVFKGKLGDGTTLTASLAPSADGSYRWYGKPYKNGGYFAGSLGFELISGAYQMVGVADSELYWAKSASAKDKSYRAGFSPLSILATAQRWIAPASGTPLSTSLQLASPVGQFNSALTSTDLLPADSSVLPTVLTLNTKNQVVVTTPSANADRFTLKTTTSNGSFTGSLALIDGRKVSVSGVLLQQPTVAPGTVIGEGLFLIPPSIKGGETVSGKIQFTAP